LIVEKTRDLKELQSRLDALILKLKWYKERYPRLVRSWKLEYLRLKDEINSLRNKIARRVRVTELTEV